MLNRAIQVKVVKADPNAPQPALNADVVVAAIRELGEDVVKVMCLYILLDTARQVIVAKASR